MTNKLTSTLLICLQRGITVIKKYSDFSRMIFNDLNTLSEIPVHRTSNKFKRMGPGVIYFNNPGDLLDR